jgi:anti-sigma factor (TIGR02949 family)
MMTWITKLFGRAPDRPMSRGGMDCHHVGELLQHYLDGHIDTDRARRIEAHLEECRQCGMEIAMYEQIKAVLASHRTRMPSESIDRLRDFGVRLANGGEPSEPWEPSGR